MADETIVVNIAKVHKARVDIAQYITDVIAREKFNWVENQLLLENIKKIKVIKP